MYIFKNKLLLMGEVWFDAETQEMGNVDVLLYKQRTYPINNVTYEECHTRLIDLQKTQDEIWLNIGKNDKYKIKRAGERDRVIYEYWENPESNILNEFADFYDVFAVQKGLKKINRTILKSRADSGLIDISQIKSNDGNPLIWHTYYRNKECAYLLHSASLKNDSDTSYQSMLGRANLYHHWQDILRFKNAGISKYDFGGWYTGNTDNQKLGINKFKEKFGGEVVKRYNCARPITLKGQLYLSLIKILRRK
ncbi:MAG: hypothetical protein RMX68_010075 [Aulosira sp. ZfuVER01]|nr:hypothetical protein [Aulosira sp. ZfuVER01]MDZ7998065.1 hypothetical protein [Aulosira sp. DedVER01a]MDZ8050459.1 hypothetical protein [Aulosira sp. ZfuCHP01]